jgi:hypothetical protein
MRQQICIAFLLMVTSTRAAVAAECSPTISSVPELPSITRGQTVTVLGDCLPKQGVKVALRTGKEKQGDKGLPPLDAKVADDGKSLSFQIPLGSFETGRYLVFVSLDSKELPVPGDLRVLSDEPAKVKIDSMSPVTVYPTGTNNTYDFEISGENLGKAPDDNIVEVVGRGPQTAGSSEDCKRYASDQAYEKMCLSYGPGMEGKKLKVSGFNAGNHEGPVNIRLRVGNNVSDPKIVTLSALPEWEVRALAIVASVVFALIVLAMVWKGIKLAKSAQSGGVLDWFFLDRQTGSYSLSKFQLIAWTAVAIFGYVYVLLCRTLIQWDFHFPPIPNGWPTLLGVSAATTVAAVGITTNRGSKGAGPLEPSFADFISSGGMVTGDRFQFFVWTLVGFLGFLLLVLLADPSTLKEVPDVPQGFLYLMGISAAGYLGGKVVRLPGPVIQQLLVTAKPLRDAQGKEQPVELTINLRGENLSTDAAIKIDGVQLRPKDEFEIVEVKPQNAPADPSFRAEVNVVLKNAAKYVQGQYELTFINKDGQMAVAEFPVDPLKLNAVDNLTAEGNPVTITVTGENFGDNMTAEWIDPSKTITVIPTDKVKKKRDKEAEITLTPGTTKGQGTLTLISANQLRASSPVQVLDLASASGLPSVTGATA